MTGMSAEMAMRAALVAALRGDGALAGMLNGVFDGTPVKASFPHVVVGECLGADWGTKDAEGRELRIGLTLFDQGESPARLAGLIGPADAAVKAIAGPVEGWALAGIAFVRSRIVKSKDQGWSALVDYRVRMLREAGHGN